MSIKRTQGRPKQGEGQVGRERIISGFVEMVRSGRYDDISRKQIAEYVGITPALITYYFPKGDFLLKEALAPVFMQWYSDLDFTLSDKTKSWSTRLGAALEIIVDLNRKEAHVESIYRELCRRGVLDNSTIEAMKNRLIEFLAEGFGPTEAQPEFLETMANLIWGACQHCAPLKRSDFVYDLIERAIDDGLERIAAMCVRCPVTAESTLHARERRRKVSPHSVVKTCTGLIGTGLIPASENAASYAGSSA